MRSTRISFNKLVFAIFILGLAIELHSCKGDQYEYPPPSIAPIASGITQTEADIRGLAMYAESVFFEYGVSTSYGQSVSGGTWYLTPNNGGQVSFVAHAHLSGLKPGTTYHYRGVAKYKRKTNYSIDHTFTTLE